MRIHCCVLALIVLSACSAPGPTPASLPSPSNSPTRTDRAILTSAHRGGAGLAPENTLASFRNGLTFSPDFLEMDVHLSKDGAIVVMHDPTLDRTTDGRGRVRDFTLAELQRLNAAARYAGATSIEPPPILGQVLDLARPTKTGLEIEIKVGADGKPYPGIAQKVLNEVDARGMLSRVRIMAFEFETLKQVRAINPQATTIALMTTDYMRGKNSSQAGAIIDEVAPFASGIGVDRNWLTPELVAQAHVRKMVVGVWTVDSETEMNKFIAMGVDSITTNRPDVLNKVLGR